MAAYRRVDDLRSPAGWLPVHRDQLRAQRSVSSMGNLYLLPGTNWSTTFLRTGQIFWPLTANSESLIIAKIMPHIKIYITRMWANAQCDGRSAEYRWRPLFNTAKFGWGPLLECRAVTLPRSETRWNLQGCSKLANRSQPLVGRSSPYYKNTWRRYQCLTSFFRMSIHALAAKIQPDKVVQWCCAKMAIFCVLYFQGAVCSIFQTCILKSH